MDRLTDRHDKASIRFPQFSEGAQKIRTLILDWFTVRTGVQRFSYDPCALKGGATLTYVADMTEDARRNKGGADLQVTHWSVSDLPQMGETALHSWLYQKWDNTNNTRASVGKRLMIC